MKKMNMRRMLLVGGISILISSTFNSVIKAENLTADQLYINSYKLVTQSIELKSQKSINAARVSIEALRETGAEWAIGEFSKQVDQIQHPILVKFITAYDKAKSDLEKVNKEPSLVSTPHTPGISVQLSIEAARTALEPELPMVWRSSYSSALDKIQQDYAQKALALNNIFIKASSGQLSNGEYTGQENMQASNILGDIIRYSTDSELTLWAKKMFNQVINFHFYNV